MKPLRAPPDAARLIRDALTPVLQGRFPGIVVGLNVPREWTPSSPPIVVIAGDGGPVRWPISTDTQVRISAWSDGRSRAREIAGYAAGHVLSIRPPGVARVRAGASLIDDVDSHNGGRVATVSVVVTARTIPA